jgi:predicted nucleotidyltransferase component of viral defense system
MIPQAYITEWGNQVLWQTNEQVEQDLMICRALVEIFSDELLAKSLAFRGGTALHKLYLNPQPRYSEDIDLVQIKAEPFGPLVDRLRERLAFLGEPARKQKENNFTLHYRFESEFPPIQKLRLKVETNCREHFAVLGYQKFPFQVNSSWFKGACNITTYPLEELLGTKIRALYQRRKGRDLYDLFKALVQVPDLQNLEAKIQDDEFTGDIAALLRPTEKYDQEFAFEYVRTELLEQMEVSKYNNRPTPP